jgi:ADP-ribose pyrophosphatase YjhB (NUDIX family)
VLRFADAHGTLRREIMEPFRYFLHCPKCGATNAGVGPRQPFDCANCGFYYYFNSAVAVAAILLGPDGRALFLRRAKDPGKGRLGLPGGFVDIGETAEDALRREIMEEVNLEVNHLEFLCSRLNQYLYRGVDYPVLDFFFITRADDIGGVTALDGVESFAWRDPASVREEEMAFNSNWQAIRRFCLER